MRFCQSYCCLDLGFYSIIRAMDAEDAGPISNTYISADMTVIHVALQS